MLAIGVSFVIKLESYISNVMHRLVFHFLMKFKFKIIHNINSIDSCM